jgi:hypothetical protein
VFVKCEDVLAQAEGRTSGHIVLAGREGASFSGYPFLKKVSAGLMTNAPALARNHYPGWQGEYENCFGV